MFDYLNGLLTKIESSYIVLDVNGIGFKIYMPNPYVFEEGVTSKVYLYNHVREDENITAPARGEVKSCPAGAVLRRVMSWT